MKSLKHLIGLDTLQEKYAYGVDEQMGFTAKAKIPERWVQTTCGYCSVGCGMYIGVRGGKAVSVRGDPQHPVNEGMLCPKGLAEHYAIHAPNRALYPLLKTSGKLRQVHWEEALDIFVERFRAIQTRSGLESIGIISTGQLVTEEFYTLGKLVQLGLRTSNYDGNTTLCMASAVSGYKRSFGSDGPPGAYEDLATADCIFLIGANIAENHPILTCWLNKNRNPNKTLIVADPRVTKTAMMANLYLPLRPRSDVALLNGIMHILIKENLIDQEFIQKHTSGFDELKEVIRKYPLDVVSQMTGLSLEAIQKTALTYGRAKAAFIGWTMGVNHSDQGTETVMCINNLALITGQIGRIGSSPSSITGQCNAMGTRETGFTSSLPGYRKFEKKEDRQELAGFWGIEPSLIPTRRGFAYPDIIEGIVRGQIRGLWIIATNPVVSYPNKDFLLDALSRLDFLVVQDGFHPTPTSELADLVLPAAIWGEKEGTFTNSERRVSKVNKAVEPPGSARTDFNIFLSIARAWGCYEKLFPGWTTPEDAFNEWRKVSKGRLCDYSGISYSLLERYRGIHWPFSDENEENQAPLTRRLYSNGIFQTEDGKAKLWPIECHGMPENPSLEFPFILNTGRTVEHWHTRTKTGGVPILQKLSPAAWVEMNPRDAKALQLKQGERVRVVSQRGSVEGIALRITEITAPGQIFIPFHFFKTNANNLTLNVFDPISREPNYKQCAVRVEAQEKGVTLPLPLKSSLVAEPLRRDEE